MIINGWGGGGVMLRLYRFHVWGIFKWATLVVFKGGEGCGPLGGTQVDATGASNSSIKKKTNET